MIYDLEFPYRVGRSGFCQFAATENIMLFSPLNSRFVRFSSSGAVRCHTTNRTPVPEPNPSKAEKTSDVLLQSPDLRAGEALSSTEVSSQRRASCPGQESKDD